MRKLLYIKYQDYRKSSYDVVTKIYEDGNRRLVVKEAAAPEAQFHIDRMAAFYEAQKEAYRAVGLELNVCSRENGSLVFEYLDGRNLQICLDELLKNQRTERAKELLREYFRRIEALTVSDPEGKKGLPAPANYDLNLDNVVCCGDRWVLMDYEWSMDEQIELDFLIWRILDNYQLHNPAGAARILEDLYREYGIDEEKQARFKKRELAFQEMVTDPYSLRRYTEKFQVEQKEIYRVMEDAAADVSAMKAAKEEKEREIDALLIKIEQEMDAAFHEDDAALKEKEQEIQRLEAWVRQIESDYQNSTCWRITAPIRAAGRLFRKEKN